MEAKLTALFWKGAFPILELVMRKASLPSWIALMHIGVN